MKKLKFMADYYCYPLWLSGDDEVGNVDPDSLPISALLKEELKIWATQYDATLNLDDPANSGFLSKEEEVLFKQKGRYLMSKLQEELGKDYEITYKE
ncbi:hypothetical protein AH716_004578 [Salmonella enterica subsp. enterica]|nr:hypothetical protein [Salmonella enterica subsp. enterica]EDT6694827.1 hypothetical protein [Salmonella enterica subsp. enterica serovar Gbadago]